MLLSALVLAAAVPVTADDPDLRCIAAVSSMLGTVSEAPTPDPEMITGLTAIFMYYMGRVDARQPGFDYGKSLGSLMNKPGYERELPADLRRCGAEAEARGSFLKDLGEELKASVPLNETRPG